MRGLTAGSRARRAMCTVCSLCLLLALHALPPTQTASATESSAAPATDVDESTGLARGPGFETVRANCTVCHSAALVTQNRATREGWLAMIRWMQETQRLWPLGESEDVILDYLATHYSPSFSGRRPPLATDLMPAPLRQ